MSNSAAAAVLTTADLPEAIRAVRTLLGIADIGQGEIDFEATIRSPDVLAQVRHVLPDLESVSYTHLTLPTNREV